ncbi:unnamed protein product [Anisakis simplex]|uniref:Uncharacterized protein n=1 Tax=Anisakis simplex TaxID=6269 RepID=A0A0M3JRX2_ANISI|nr:unnamed protein product [Anisakis simplex]
MVNPLHIVEHLLRANAVSSTYLRFSDAERFSLPRELKALGKQFENPNFMFGGRNDESDESASSEETGGSDQQQMDGYRLPYADRAQQWNR